MLVTTGVVSFRTAVVMITGAGAGILITVGFLIGPKRKTNFSRHVLMFYP